MPNAAAEHRRRNFNHWNQSLDPLNLRREGAPQNGQRQLALALTQDFRLALQRLGPLRGRTILDLGGGLGLHAVHFAQRGAKVLIADLSPARLERACALAARHRVEDRVSAVACAAEELPFADGAFDRIFTKSVLIHTELPAAAAELCRVLAPGGRACFVEPLAGNPFVNAYRATLAPPEWKGLTNYFNGQRLGVLKAPFRAAGCKMREDRQYLLAFFATPFHFMFPHAGLYRASEAALAALDRACFAAAPPLRRWAWFAITTFQKPQ